MPVLKSRTRFSGVCRPQASHRHAWQGIRAKQPEAMSMLGSDRAFEAVFPFLPTVSSCRWGLPREVPDICSERLSWQPQGLDRESLSGTQLVASVIFCGVPEKRVSSPLYSLDFRSRGWLRGLPRIVRAYGVLWARTSIQVWILLSTPSSGRRMCRGVTALSGTGCTAEWSQASGSLFRVFLSCHL